MRIRTGIGYDSHRFEEGRPLILGGTLIPSDRGLKGHSDADVLIHAIVDALLGAAGEGDIGCHFPDTDPVYEGIASTLLLQKTVEIIYSCGYSIGNIDSTLICEHPKIQPYIAAIKNIIAACCGIPLSDVSVKAKTNEGMGWIGRGKGIAALAIATLEMDQNNQSI
ncbi:MAG: 2-C-methyl-D-erythritol 2,4-cyclodiphosphate synthase [Deltaproteobacteria bacterium]|nr:2-C-methyl-D-erythritol 2,4-cyclodiphosphate synthase [Deltaproteobacteria bacterium]